MQRTSTGRRVLSIALVIGSALLAARWLASRWLASRWLASRESAATSIDGPAIERPSIAAVHEPNLANVAAIEAAPATTDRREALAIAGLEAESTAPLVPAVRTQRFTLSGVLVLATGRDELVDPPRVRLVDELGFARATPSSASREFEFRGLPAGRYWLDVRSREDGNAHAIVDLVGDRQIELTLSIPPVVLVRVEGWSPMERVVRHLRAVATREPPGERIVRGDRTGAVGRYATLQPDEKVPYSDVLGLLVLDADESFHASLTCDEIVIDTRFVASGQREVVFDVPPTDPRVATGAVRFRVVDARTGAPVRHASAWFDGANLGVFACPGGIGAKVGLMPGSWHMSFQTPGHVQRVVDVEIIPGRTTDLGDLLSASGVSVSGKVLLDGVDVVANVRCDPCDERGQLDPPFPEIHELRADGGSFAFKALHPSWYRLEFRVTEPPDVAETVLVVDARDASVRDLRVEVARGMPLVVAPSEQRRRGWQFRVLDTKGVRIATRDLDGPWPASVLVVPGSYTVELVRGSDTPVERVEVEVASTPVRISMP